MEGNSISIAGQIVLIILYAGTVCIVTRYYLHLLQAANYRPRGYLQKLGSRPIAWQPLIVLAIPVSMLILGYAAAGFVTLFVYFIAISFFYRKFLPRFHLVSSQPFQATHRILRLDVTIGLIWMALVVILTLLRSRPLRILLILLAMWFMAQPFWVLLALAVNVPLEERIRRHYEGMAASRIAAQSDHLTVVGITGSYGKTTVKDALAAILSTEYKVLKTPASYNTRMGIARTINERLTREHQVFVCELGALQVGDIDQLCRMVQPSIGLITAMGSRNMDTFHSVRNIVRTRYELLDAVDERGGLMFVNGDNLLIRRHMKYPDAITYGFAKDCSYQGVLLEQDQTGSTFAVTGPEGQHGEFHTRLLGRYNLVDIMGAVAVANRMGIPMERMEAPIAELKPKPHQLKITQTGQTTVIDDTDNAYPDATAVALETLSMFECVRILITPGIPARNLAAEDILQLAVRCAVSADYIILVGSLQTEDIYRSMIGSGGKADRIFKVDTMSDARVLAEQFEPEKERVILLENSLTAKDESLDVLL